MVANVPTTKDGDARWMHLKQDVNTNTHAHAFQPTDGFVRCIGKHSLPVFCELWADITKFFAYRPQFDGGVNTTAFRIVSMPSLMSQMKSITCEP